MRELIKHIKKNIVNFDISPFHPSKVASLIILIWGLNTAIFLGEVIALEKCGSSYLKSTSCTETKKIQKVFIYVEDFIITKFSTVSFFPILNPLIPENDVVIKSLARGPPTL